MSVTIFACYLSPWPLVLKITIYKIVDIFLLTISTYQMCHSLDNVLCKEIQIILTISISLVLFFVLRKTLLDHLVFLEIEIKR